MQLQHGGAQELAPSAYVLHRGCTGAWEGLVRGPDDACSSILPPSAALAGPPGLTVELCVLYRVSRSILQRVCTVKYKKKRRNDFRDA